MPPLLWTQQQSAHYRRFKAFLYFQKTYRHIKEYELWEHLVMGSCYYPDRKPKSSHFELHNFPLSIESASYTLFRIPSDDWNDIRMLTFWLVVRRAW